MTPEEVAEKQRKRRESALREVLGTQAGRDFFWDVLERAGLHSGSFSTEPLEMAFNEGRRAVALDVAAEAQRVCPELYMRSLKERLDAEAQRLREANQPG